MNGSSILIPALILGAIGTVLGVAIALVNRWFWVWEDPRIDQAEDLLPGTDCGACGQPGCRAFAEALIEGEGEPAECTNMSVEEMEHLAKELNLEAGDAQDRVARLLCAGGSNVSPRQAYYEGAESCAAAVAVSGGGKACPWGCVGLADCAVACDFDAIRMNENDLPVVDPDLCTACEDCVEACPLDLFTIMPAEHKLIVQCKSLMEGEPAREACQVACDACARCVRDAPDDLMYMEDGLAHVNYEHNELSEPELTESCPTRALRWVEGAQFQEETSPEDKPETSRT